MIVPRTRLLVWFAVWMLPLVAVAATMPRLAPVCYAGMALFLITAGVDGWKAGTALAGIAMELPEIVRLQRNQPGTIPVGMRNASKEARLVRVGLPFPNAVRAAVSDMEIRLPDGVESSTVAWSCQPVTRGLYILDKYFLEGRSRLGLWAWREGRDTACELRVYPDFIAERKNVAALFLNRGHIGIHAQRQAGKGREFEKLRDYVPGDGYDEVHWKASAKRGRPVTKVFQVERTQEVYVVLDASRLMARDGAQFERYITSALLLGIAAEQQGDAYGVIAFSDRVLHFARARSGKSQFNTCRDMLYALQPQGVTPDFEELATFIRTRLRKRALLVFLTALDDPAMAESFLRAISLICRQHLILVNMLRPIPAQPLFSDGAVSNADDIYEKLGGHLLWHDLRELGKVLQRRGVRFTLIEKEALSARLVSEYMNVKSMQLI